MKKTKTAKTSILIFLASFIGFFSFSLASPSPVYAAVSPECKSTLTSAALQNCLKNNRIVKRIQQIVNFLSVAVGLVVVAMIILGGIQYTTAGDNPQKVTAAKMRITNALIALGIFMFMAAFLQWLVPGGIFG